MPRTRGDGCFGQKSVVRIYDDDKEFYRVLPIDEVSKGDYIQSFELQGDCFKMTIEEAMDFSITKRNPENITNSLVNLFVLKNGEEKHLTLTSHHYIYVMRDGVIIKATAGDVTDNDKLIVFDYEQEKIVPSFCKMSFTSTLGTETDDNVYNVFTKSFNLIVSDFAVTCLTSVNEWDKETWFK